MGDVLMVTRLNRLARSTRDLLNVLAMVSEKGAAVRRHSDPCRAVYNSFMEMRGRGHGGNLQSWHVRVTSRMGDHFFLMPRFGYSEARKPIEGLRLGSD